MTSKPLSDVLITFKAASHIPIGDFMSQSSDPYLFARLTPRTPPSSEHPPFPLTFRTSTLRHTRDPEWNETWHLGGIPPEGFELQVKILDEDKPGDYDDGLGVASLSVTQLPSGSNDGGAGEAREYTVKIMKRKASRRAYAATYISAWCSGDFKKQRGRLTLSIQNLGKSTCTRNCPCVLGPMRWSIHVSPMIGLLTHTRAPPTEEDESLTSKLKEKAQKATEKARNKAQGNHKQSSSPYLFEANKIQLLGTLPADLRNKYVEYRPFIGFLFSGRGIRGWFLQRALHAQHRRVYTYDLKTTYGHVATPPAIAKLEAGDAQKHVPDHEKPEDEADEFAASRQFLKMVHYDEAPGPDVPGGRLYTYVITLQGEWRFTETGPEFAIQFLSKHSMHSDVAPEVAVAGEFFVRRRRGKGGMPLPNGIDKDEKKEKEGDDKAETDAGPDTEAKRNMSNASTEAADGSEKKRDEESPDSKDQDEEHEEGPSDSKDLDESHDDASDSKEKQAKQADKDSIHVSNKPSHQVGHSHNPSNFVLIIDNDSGTYRPDKSQLPSFKKYLERNLPGLKIKVMACDDPKLKKMKEEQKPKKEVTKARRIAQPSDSSDSGSSSDFPESE